MRPSVGRLLRGGGASAFSLDLNFRQNPVLPPSALFTRATAGLYFGSDGFLATAASGVPRFEYDQTTRSFRGFLVEKSAVNVALWNRDLTNAVWTKTSCTAAKTQTGIDGVANSASLLTASGSNATCLQTVTLASSSRKQSTFIHRVTGSGTIQMTTDGGTTWTTITVAAGWTRVQCAAQTVTNPSLGFRIVTSGDAVAIDYVQNEVGPQITSPIQTSGAAVTRNADDCYIPNIHREPWFNPKAGSIYFEGDVTSTPGATTVSFVSVDADSTAAEIILGMFDVAAPLFQVSNSGTQCSLDLGAISVDVPFKMAGSYAVNDFAGVAVGGVMQTDLAGSIPSGLSYFGIGRRSAAGAYLCGHIARIGYAKTRLSNDALNRLVQ